MATENATNALAHQIANHANTLQRFEALQDALGLDTLPQRLECFDISHTQGEATVASCVVMDIEGPKKSDYRRFNIEGITPGDDYAAMHQALHRRYLRIKTGEGMLPDILFIDGGKGQLSEAKQVLDDLQIDSIMLVGVAKGPDRKPGMETMHILNQKRPLNLTGSSAASLLVQQIRDEAHRFAITGHRQRRAKARKASSLESIPGLGPKRRQLLLKQFGGLQGVTRAGVDDLAAVKGVSKALARRIYDRFHAE
jgi:excinuclease ABC subunit C